jgi:hypothetical protein
MGRRGLLRGLEIGVENARTIAVNGLIAMRGRPGGTGDFALSVATLQGGSRPAKGSS